MKQGNLEEIDRCFIHGFGGLINLLEQRLDLHPMDDSKLTQLEADCNRLLEGLQRRRESPAVIDINVNILDWWAEGGLKGILNIIEAGMKNRKFNLKTPFGLEEQVSRLLNMLVEQRGLYGN